jgi:hypothetical protein
MNEVLINKVKEKLLKQNPNMSKEDLESASNDIIKEIGSKNKKDEEGHIIVAENVKVILSGNITSSSTIKE